MCNGERFIVFVAEWANAEKTILRQTIQPPTTYEELGEGLEYVYAMLDSVDHHVIIITKLDPWLAMPKDVIAIGRRIEMNERDNLVLHVVVGTSHVLRVGLTLARIVAPKALSKVRVVASDADANAVVETFLNQG